MFGKQQQPTQQQNHVSRRAPKSSSNTRQDFQNDQGVYSNSPFPSKQDARNENLSSPMSSTSHPSSSLSSPPAHFSGEHFPFPRHPLDMPVGGQFPLIRCDPGKIDFDYQRHHQHHFPQFFDCFSCSNTQPINEGCYSSCPPLLPQEVEFDFRHRSEHPLSQYPVPQNPPISPAEDYPYYIDFNLVPPQGHDLSSLPSSDVQSKNDGRVSCEYSGFQSSLDSTSGSTVTSGSPGVPPLCQIKTEGVNSTSEKNRQEVKPNRAIPGKRKSNLQDSIRKHRRREQNRIAARKCREKKKVQVDSILKGYQRTLKENERLQKEMQELHNANNRLNDVINRHQKICPMLQNIDVIPVSKNQGVTSSKNAKSSPQFEVISAYAESFCEYPTEIQNISTSPRNAFYQP